jgi:DNA-binding NarL/FixJ family response regulator
VPRVLIVDGHHLYRRALRSALESLATKTQVLEADNLDSARQCLDQGRIDLVLIDLSAPGVASLETLRWLHKSYPQTRFAAMAASGTRSDIVRSLDAGLYGFISKSQSDEEIIAAIKDILSGRIYVPVQLTQVDGNTISLFGGRTSDTDAEAVEADARLDKLTRRQRDVLPLLARGMSNKEIARALRIAESTTKIHASALLRVLGARNRTEAAAIARTLLTDAEPPIRPPTSEIQLPPNSRRR